MGMTMTQKILAAHAGLAEVKAGQLINAKLDQVLGNDITTPVAINEFEKAGFDGVFDNARINIVLDHFVPNKDIKSAQQSKQCRQFAAKYDIVVNSDALYSGRVTHRMLNFYDTQAFNDWSVSNFDVLHRYAQQDAQHYKISLKDYIFAFNHDAAYRSGKGKIRSWVRAGYNEKARYCPRAALLETPERIVFRSESVRRPLFEAISRSGIMTRNLLRLYRKKA